MGALEDNIRELIIDRYGSIPKLAQATGLPAQTIYSVLRNGFSGASLTTIIPIVEALEIDPIQLTRGKIASLSTIAGRVSETPLVSTDDLKRAIKNKADLASAFSIDESGFREQNAHMALAPTAHLKQHPSSFFVQVSTRSASHTIPLGVLALIDPDFGEMQDSALYLVMDEGERFEILRSRKLHNGVSLEPESDDPTFRPVVYDFNNPPDSFTVVGQVVWYCPPLSWHA